MMKPSAFRPHASIPRRPRLDQAPAIPAPEPLEQPSDRTPWVAVGYLASLAVTAALVIYGARQIDRGVPGWR